MISVHCDRRSSIDEGDDMAKHKHRRPTPGVQTPPQHKPAVLPFVHRHPYWFAAGLLTVLFVLLFNPLFFSGKTLLPPDTVASYSFLPFVNDALARHVYPLWNPYIFGGMPFFASMSAKFIDPINDLVIGASHAVRLVSRSADLVEFQRVLLFLVNNVLLGFFLFLLLKRRKAPTEAALFGAVTFAFMPQLIGQSVFGHNTLLATAALVPLVLLLADALLEKRNLLFFCLTGLAVGVQFLRAHVQICYYTQLVVGLYFLFWAVTEMRAGRWKRALGGGALLAGAIAAGLLVSSVLNLSVFEYSKYSIRGGESGGLDYAYATGWSFSPAEMATFLIPSFMGFGRETYWGGMPFTDFPHYFGLVTFVLAVLGLALRRDRTTLFFGTLAGLSLLASFGKYFPILYWPMYKFLPFFNKFRSPDMIHVLFKFSMVVLAATGIQSLFESADDPKHTALRRIKRTLVCFGGVFGLLFLVLLIGKSAYLSWAAKAGDARYTAYGMAVRDGLKAMCLFGATAFLVLRIAQKRLRPAVFGAALVLLTLADLWMVDRKFVEFRPRADVAGYFAETPDVRYLKEQKTLFRILPVLDQRAPNWYAYHFIQSAFGYHAAKVRSVQELLEAFKVPNDFFFTYTKQVAGGLAWRQPSEIPADTVRAQHAFLKMMNVRYLLCPYPIPDSALTAVVQPQAQGMNFVYEYRDALPRVFFPKRTAVVRGKEAALRYMASGMFDPAETAVVEEPPPFDMPSSAVRRAEVTAWDLHRIRVKAELDAPGLLVFSEIFYPKGWTASVDGKPARIVKADHALRAVYLGPGSHEVAMHFSPASFGLGLRITAAVTALLVLGVVFGAASGRKRKPADGAPPVQAVP
jgi:hypothetical protein